MYISLLPVPGYDLELLEKFGYDGEYNLFYGQKMKEKTNNTKKQNGNFIFYDTEVDIEETDITTMEWGTASIPIRGKSELSLPNECTFLFLPTSRFYF